MAADSEVLIRQLEMAWKLTTFHLAGLTTEECLWLPARKGLHVHHVPDGKWRADWPDHEGYDLGPPSRVLDQVSDADLRSAQRTRWPFQDRPFGDVVAWVNVELTKNAAEIGYARFLYAARLAEVSDRSGSHFE